MKNTTIKWREGAPAEFHKDIVAIGTGKTVLVMLKCSEGEWPELCLAECKGGRMGRLYRTGKPEDHEPMSRLLPRDYWPQTIRGCGGKVDPLVKTLARKHERAVKKYRQKNGGKR